jgi:hypothetical protein
MGLSKLSIWVRDTAHPSLPYQSTGHNWVAVILSCDLQPLSYGAVNNGIFELTDKGKAGGRIHGQVDVPPGFYIVLAVATCKNVFTDWTMVQTCCNQEVCANLIPKALSTCTNELIWALNIAQFLKASYSSSSPAGREIPKEVVSKAIAALEELRKHIPEDMILPNLPISLDKLMKMAEKERGAQKD